MSSSSKQQSERRCRLINSTTLQHSRNTNAYFDQNQSYHHQRKIYSMRKERSMTNSIPPRHREQFSSTFRKQQDSIKPFPSTSSSSINSDLSNNHLGSVYRKDLQTKNLAAAARRQQQNGQPPTNLNVIQTLMNSLILQQQQSTSQSPSTIQLQYQLTNALLATSRSEWISRRTILLPFFFLVIQQRLKETALQAQAQQIQAAIPTLLAAQAMAYQQSGQFPPHSPPNVAHPGTKFNNRPLMKFAVTRPSMMMPFVQSSRHRLGRTNSSMTVLPTYQQVQEIERGISLDEAIHFKGAINITDAEKDSSNKIIN